jgi:hypothetical protein
MSPLFALQASQRGGKVHLRASLSPRSHRRCWTARPDLGERRPSRLVATAAAIYLKRASATAPPQTSADWQADREPPRRARRPRCGRLNHEGRSRADRESVVVDANIRLPRRPHADARQRADARGRYDGIRETLAAGVMTKKRSAAPRSSHLFLRIKCRRRFSRCLGR